MSYSERQYYVNNLSQPFVFLTLLTWNLFLHFASVFTMKFIRHSGSTIQYNTVQSSVKREREKPN